MDLIAHLQSTNRRQYLEQANYVYLGTVFSSLALLPLMYFTGYIWPFIFTIISILISIITFLMNRRGYHGLASTIYLTNLTFQAIFNSLAFGTKAGFVFYFFNMAVLIIYTNWKGLYKLLTIGGQTALFLALSIYSLYVPPLHNLSITYTIIFFIINIILNIIGVAHSAHFYLVIARKAQADLRLYAITDYLTGLPNRNAFIHFIRGLKNNPHKDNKVVGMMMIDIDHFKAINDNYGHPVGDQVLVHLAQILSNLMGPYDFFGRYGGEEFVAIHFSDDQQSMLEFAEHLRATIATTCIQVDDHQINFTISIGLLYHHEGIDDYERSISIADTLLYVAKEAGRNQVKSQII